MTSREAFEFAVLERISLRAPVNLEELLQVLPGHTWNQLFAAIDSLSRREAITLRRINHSTYHIFLGPQFERGRATSSARNASSSPIYS